MVRAIAAKEATQLEDAMRAILRLFAEGRLVFREDVRRSAWDARDRALRLRWLRRALWVGPY